MPTLPSQRPPLPPPLASPPGQRSPSTAGASPSVAHGVSSPQSHVDDPPHHPAHLGGSRASVACASCRRSKTKCHNHGYGSVCQSCRQRGKSCEWFSPEASAATATVKRRESTVAEVEALSRKRRRPLASAATHRPSNDTKSGPQDALDTPSLTPKVWEELVRTTISSILYADLLQFEIYETHFASDFPFLHRKRFLKPLHQPHQSIVPGKNLGPQPRPPHDTTLLLGFLTLTARYHPELLKDHSSPHATATYWADATLASLGPESGRADLERVQALLFIGFYRWCDTKGAHGSYLLAVAARYAQSLGYEKFDDGDQDGEYDESRDSKSDDENTRRETFIDNEIKRRTYWSCFILDRFTNCNGYRPPMLDPNNIATQLPCSDQSFNKGFKVRTRWLRDGEAEYEKRREAMMEKVQRFDYRELILPSKRKRHERFEWEIGKDESELSLYIRTAKHFGKVMGWALNKGRRREIHPPWDPKSNFSKLNAALTDLRNALPNTLTLSPENTEDHICDKTSRSYLVINALLTLCTIALYREYLAFAPWQEEKPKGPLDGPKIVGTPPSPEYWIDQARQCFAAARDFAQAIDQCQRAGKLVDTAIMVWTTYVVGWCAGYCHYFPRMDVDSALSSRKQPSAWDVTNRILYDMSDRFAIARQQQYFLGRVHRWYEAKRVEWKLAGGSPGSTTSDSSGGLQYYTQDGFEKEHLEYGGTDDREWVRTMKADDWKLKHDPEGENHNGQASPTANYKVEATPVSTPASHSGFTHVNRVKATSEAPSLPSFPPPDAVTSTSSVLAPIRAQPSHTQPTSVYTYEQNAHAMDGLISGPSTYDHMTGAQAQATGFVVDSYAHAGRSTYHDPNLAWQEQQAQSSHPLQSPRLRSREELHEFGLQSVGNGDLQGLSLANYLRNDDMSYPHAEEPWGHIVSPYAHHY
ncbi:hypothetical protein ACEQ8H_005542 [Pleosporales sp. CAS-2024a]